MDISQADAMGCTELRQLDFEHDYPAWREQRLAAWQNYSIDDMVTLKNLKRPTAQELATLKQQCESTNFAIYSSDPSSKHEAGHKESVRQLAPQIGMQQLDQNLCADNDAITTLKVMDLGRAQGYIPYTTRPLNWHTDGYYNQPGEHIRSFLLHCEQNALEGGENMLLNYEMLYIHLHDLDPAYTAALSHPEAMTIPANIENGVEIRPAQTGPVFYRDPTTNYLQMRYTARTRSIEWQQNEALQEALKEISHFLNESNEQVLRITLQPGQGLICNNILHGRSAFSNPSSSPSSTNGQWANTERVLYRARSFNRLFSDNSAC